MKSKEREPERSIQILDQKGKPDSPLPKADGAQKVEIVKDPENAEVNIDFNKMTTLNFKTLNEETDGQIDSTLKKDINLLEEDFKKMGLIDSHDRFRVKDGTESKQLNDGRNQPSSTKGNQDLR